jgi:hypothetical protein
MILPSKKIRPENSLIYIGGKILDLLDEPKTVSQLWEEFKIKRMSDFNLKAPEITYDWFVLALDLLFVLGTFELLQGKLHRRRT